MFRLSTNKKVQSTSFTRYFHKFFNKGPFICTDVKDQCQLCEIWISQFLSIGNFRLFARYHTRNWFLKIESYMTYKTMFTTKQVLFYSKNFWMKFLNFGLLWSGAPMVLRHCQFTKTHLTSILNLDELIMQNHNSKFTFWLTQANF